MAQNLSVGWVEERNPTFLSTHGEYQVLVVVGRILDGIDKQLWK